MSDPKGLTVQRYDIESQGNDTPDVTAWTDKDGDWVKYTDYTVLAERLNQAECNQELVELYWNREQKAIKERDELRVEVARLKEKLTHAAEDW